MKAVEIITIGDELLTGLIQDANSPWIAVELNKIGLKVRFMTSVSDKEDEIINAVGLAGSRADIILITGGLGPTKDDITKNALCKFFRTHLRFDEESYRNIERLFNARGREVTQVNRQQAELPATCTPLRNNLGTAPGMWFEEKEKIYVSMPGVPHEMKGIMQDLVLKKLKDRFDLPPVIHESILTQGIGESFLSDLIAPWEDALPKHIKLAYLPTAGILRLRLTLSGFEEPKLRDDLEKEISKLKAIAGKYIFGRGEDTLEKLIGDQLRSMNATLCTAESCTGGYLAHRITTVPGSSDYFIGSIIAYDNELKTSLLDVDTKHLREYGAVSEKVAVAMAEGARKRLKTDYAIATTGIAGPSGASPDKPVGTVWIAIAGPERSYSTLLRLGTERFGVILNTAAHAFHRLSNMLAGNEPD